MDPSTFSTVESQARSHARASMNSTISRLFERRRSRSTGFGYSQRTSAACEVPIFMSQSSTHLYTQQQSTQNPYLHERIAQGTDTVEENHRPLTVPGSSVYSQTPDEQYQTRFMDRGEDHIPPSPILEHEHDLEEGNLSLPYTSSENRLVQEKRRRKKRVSESLRQRIDAKRKLGVAFGITVLATTITYLVLAVTGTAHGLMFHILSVLFILLLAGVFLHSAISLVMLQRRRRARQGRHRDWHGSVRTGSSLSRSCSESSTHPFMDSMTEKPVRILDGPDEVLTTTPRGKNKKVVRQPPPVYGNFRESQRMNPEMVYWHKQTPSPTTPTYEEAMNDVETAVSHQPPQYVSPKRAREGTEGQQISSMHPLERERLVGLMSNTTSSRR